MRILDALRSALVCLFLHTHTYTHTHVCTQVAHIVHIRRLRKEEEVIKTTATSRQKHVPQHIINLEFNQIEQRFG